MGMESRFIWMDGKLVEFADATVHFLNVGLHYGLAVFEGIRCYDTDRGPAVFRLTEHVERLIDSAHVLGLRDIVMKRADAESDEFGIIDVVRYMARGEKPVGDGHILADLTGPRFRAATADSPQQLAGSPMHNPFGRLRLVAMRDIAEAN